MTDLLGSYKTEFYDCHTHEVTKLGHGGFLIALDGKRGSDGGYNNEEVITVSNSCNMLPVQYVTSHLETNLKTKILKYHPRRELYSPREVSENIIINKPSAVILDTLNRPAWSVVDYWNIIKQFPEKKFLLSHAGGYDIVDFLEIAMFERNVWIDFSYTQHFFGWCGGNEYMPYVCSNIEYALKEVRLSKKIMYGSDSMRGEEDLSVNSITKYLTYPYQTEHLSTNFLEFVDKANL
jgi:hypothetical protein